MSERCVNCGAILPEGAKLCTSCGKIVTKNTRLRTEPAMVRKPTPDVTTQSRVYSHKPTPTAVMDRVEEEPEIVRRLRPARPETASNKSSKKKPSSKSKAGSKKKKSSGKVKFIVGFAVLIIAVLLLLYMLIYTFKIKEAKNMSFSSESSVKMSYSTFDEAAAHFFEKADWDYDLFSGEVSVEGDNKGTHYKYIFEDGKVSCVEVGDEKLTDEREIGILVERMFI